MSGLSDEEVEATESGWWFFESEFREALITGRATDATPMVDNIAESLLAEFQILLDRDGFQFAILRRELVKAFLHLYGVIQDRNKGAVIETPVVPPVVIHRPIAEVKESMKLNDLKEYWEAQTTRNWKTIHDVETSIKEFKSLHGDLPIADITKAQIIGYKDWLLGIGVAEADKKPRSPATIEKRITMLRAILQLAVNNDKLKFNPASGVKVALEQGSTSEESREPFTVENLKKIFNSPIYTEGMRYPQGRGEAQYWLPLLALYTGLRREEIGQLLREDVQQDEGTGIWHIIAKAGSGKRLKNKGSRRRIPIPPDLIAIGFVEYCKTITDGQIFPELRRIGQKAVTTSKWADWFGGTDGHLRTVMGVTDSAQVFHSFRHNFKDAARVAGLDEEVHDMLTGHSNAKVGRTYGSSLYPLEPLDLGMRKIAYKGLDLSHLMKRAI